jgi:hypothetical protein
MGYPQRPGVRVIGPTFPDTTVEPAGAEDPRLPDAATDD